MFTKIMAPVDLRHPDDIRPALDVAAGLARAHGASIVCVGVGASTPGALGHNPEEFAAKLDAFAAAEAEATGLEIAAHAAISHDPGVDLDATLLKAVADTGADLVVMQTHRPGWADHWFAAHGATVAAKAPVSVFLVR